MDGANGNCMVCNKDTEIRYIDLYVIGSEGLDVCKPCELELVDHIRTKMREYSIKRKEEFKIKKNVRRYPWLGLGNHICYEAREGKCDIKCGHHVKHEAKVVCRGGNCRAKIGPTTCQEYREEK